MRVPLAAQVAERVERIEGVRFRALFERPARPSPPCSGCRVFDTAKPVAGAN